MKRYIIKKTDADNVPIDSPEWEKAEMADIKFETPDSTYSPKTTARLLYSDGGITVRMETDEKPLKMGEKNRNGDVYKDSCMELFISANGKKEYLNFEINPLGTLLLGLGKDRYDRRWVDEKTETFDIVSVYDDEKWVLKFYLPFSFLEKVFGGYGDKFMGNLYKCGDETGHIHFLAWNEIKLEAADFHRPEFFGEFILEK